MTLLRLISPKFPQSASTDEVYGVAAPPAGYIREQQLPKRVLLKPDYSVFNSSLEVTSPPVCNPKTRLCLLLFKKELNQISYIRKISITGKNILVTNGFSKTMTI